MPAPSNHMTKQQLIDSGMFGKEVTDDPATRYFCFDVPANVRSEAANAHITHAARFATADVYVGQANDGIVYVATTGMVRGGYVELT